MSVTASRRSLLAPLAIGAALAAVAAQGAGPAAPGPAASGPMRPRTHTVVIENLRFVPETLEIRKGDTVTWQNRDLVPHTVTVPGRLESGNLGPNARWSHVFSTPATLAYVCRYHPMMKAQVIVR